MNAIPLTIDVHDEEGTAHLGERLASALPDYATVALIGTLGAGKTRLVQSLAGALGVDRRDVVSPTFVLAQEYHGRRSLYHVDAYRLKNDDEYLALGLEDFLGPSSILVVEWADRIAACLPADRLEVRIDVVGTTDRRIELVPLGPRHAKALEVLR